MMNMGTGFQYIYVICPLEHEAFLADAGTLEMLTHWLPAHRTALLKYTPACKEVMPYTKWQKLYLPKDLRDVVL